jgi:hypothetical protein
MREDFIAQLDPFLNLIPTQLSTRYRLELLSPFAAVEAIKQPASSVGVDFSAAAAEHLVNDLRRIQVQRGDRAVLELGPSVEPVQLQVVCHRVWASLPDDVAVIEPGDIADAGTVNEALAEFYDTQLKIATDRTKADEYTVRNWFENQLITPDGFRTQVREGPSGDTDSVVQTLQSSHLIRSDRIRGAEWYELSHDRFVEPIQASNAEFMRRRRSRRLKLILAALGTVFGAVILFGLVSWWADGDAAAPSLGRNATQIEFGETVSGVVESAGDISVYAFEAGEDETVLVTVDADGNLAPDVALLDAEEARLAGTAGDPQPGESGVLALPSSTSGRYLITVTGARGSTGGFDLELSRLDPGELALDTPVLGSIAGEESVGVYRIDSVKAGDSLVVRLDLDELVPFAVLELFGPNGANLFSSEAFGGVPTELVLGAPADGAYLVTIQGSGGVTGGYEMVRHGASPLGTDLTAEGEVGDRGPSVFSFQANGGETMLVSVVAPDVGLNPAVNLYDAQGRYVSSGVGHFDLPGEPWILAAPISATGLHHVTVTGSFDGERGPFQITVQRPEVSTLPLGTTVEGSIADPVAVDVYRLNASAGDSIALHTTPEEDLATASLSVFGPDGAFVASGSSSSDGSSPLTTFEAESDGSYLVAVSGFQGSAGGYTVTRLGVGRLTLGEPIRDGLEGSSGVFVYRFDAIEGRLPLITLVAPNDEGALLDMYDSVGYWVSSGVEVAPGEPLNLPTPVAMSGVHYVTVSASGAFELTATATEWDVASLVPDLVQAEPFDYLQESGGSPDTCEEGGPAGLTGEDSVLISPLYPLELNHFVWAFAASSDTPDGVAAYLDSFAAGCMFPGDPSIRLFPMEELADGYLWYITTQTDSEGARELLDSVGVIGRTDTSVVEIQLVINGFDGFYQEIEIDPSAPYDNAEARQLAEGLIEPLQARLGEMSP